MLVARSQLILPVNMQLRYFSGEAASYFPSNYRREYPAERVRRFKHRIL